VLCCRVQFRVFISATLGSKQTEEDAYLNIHHILTIIQTVMALYL